jgi:hypothetical protein
MTAGMEDLVPIYIDAQNTSYGIFQHIANQFTREYYVKVEAFDIRHWVFHGIESLSDRLVIIIDGWTAGISGTLKEDVDELINFSNEDSLISILLCMDDTAFEEIKNISGRPTCSAIGRNAKEIQLKPLDDDEFKSVCQLFYDKLQTVFHHGAEYNLDYRIPRFLRLLADMVNQDESEAFVDKDYSKIKVLPSVTNFLIFGCWVRYISYPEIEGFFQDLARAYILDRDSRIDDPTLSIMSHGKGHIVRETAEKVIGYEKLNRMREQGHIGIVRGPNGKVLILPKISEFLATAASYVISAECLAMASQDGFDEAYSYLIKQSDSFPYGDVVGARAILELLKKDYDLANDITSKLLEDAPEKSHLSEGGQSLMYFEDVGKVNVSFGKGTDEFLVRNIQPWNIMAQIASYGIQSGQIPVDLLLRILATVGSYPRTLLRPYPSSIRQNSGFHVHEISEHGSVLCHQSGIIEPITSAIQYGFYHVPKDMLRLCQFAKEKKLFFLAYRLNMVALSFQQCVEAGVAKASKAAQKILRPIVRGTIDAMCAGIKSSGRKSGKIGRNEPCPCGSGKKYKKCCGR